MDSVPLRVALDAVEVGDALQRFSRALTRRILEEATHLCVPRPKASMSQRLTDPVEALILDLLEWIGPQSRPYPEVIDAWRTSCPRLPVWEDASDRGFIGRHLEEGLELISVTAVGREFLAEHRPRKAEPKTEERKE